MVQWHHVKANNAKRNNRNIMGEHTVADVPATRLRFRVAVAQMCWRFDIIALLRIIIIEWTDAENWIYSNAQCSIRPFAFSRTCVITIVLKIYDNSHLGSMCDINTKLQRALRKCVSRGLSSGSKTSDETCATHCPDPSPKIRHFSTLPYQ